MIDLYWWNTPNGHKISMFLEETGTPYELHPVNIGRGEQFKPEFLAIAPNNRIPAIVDRDPVGGGEPISIFESGAILTYLAEKTGQLISAEPRGRYDALQWLFWQVGGLGPMAGQNHHFRNYSAETLAYPIERYTKETNRLYGVLDRQLDGRAFITGERYGIADIACYPWIVPHQGQGQSLDDFPNVKRWFHAIAERPATQRAYALAERAKQQPQMDEEAKRILFGQTARR